MDHGGGCDDEWEEEMEGKESGESCVVYGEPTSDPLYEGVTNIGKGREQVGNDGSTSKRYLASWEYIANKGGYHGK